MGTTTTNYSLYKPTNGTEQDWGALINTNFDTIDTQLNTLAGLITAESLWDRTSTTLGPQTANDNLDMGSGDIDTTGTITGTTLVGALTGNASTATALATARTIGGVSFDGTAAIVPTTIVVADESADTACFVAYFTDATGNLLPKTGTNLTFNSSTGVLTATGLAGANTFWDAAYTHSTDNTQAHTDYFLNTTDSFTGTATFNDASNADCLVVDNDGTGLGIEILQDGVLAGGKHGLYVLSSVAQDTSVLVQFKQDHTGSTADVFEINNDGTGLGIYIHQDGVSAAGKHGLYVYSNAVQNTSQLARIHQNNASAATACLEITQAGTGDGINITQTGNASGGALEIDNDGTGHGLYLHQDGVLAASKYGLYVYSNTAQVNATQLAFFIQDNASSTDSCLRAENDGTGTVLEIQSDNTFATDKHGIFVYTNSAHTNADTALVKIHQDHADSTEPALEIDCDGNSVPDGAVVIDVDASDAGVGAACDCKGIAIDVDNANATGEQHALSITMVDEAKSVAFSFINDTTAWTSSKTVGTDAPAKWIGIQIAGTDYFIPAWTAS